LQAALSVAFSPYLAMMLALLSFMLDAGLKIPWIFVPAACTELWLCLLLIQMGWAARVWPWYGLAYLLTGLVTLTYCFSATLALFDPYPTLLFMSGASSFLPYLVLLFSLTTYETRWGLRQFGAWGWRDTLLRLEEDDSDERAYGVV